MAISDRLNKLTTDITNAYTSIENKGGTIPANKNTNNLSTAIDSIEVIEQATAEGESLSLTNTKAMPYKDYVVEGKSVQEGTPSPSNPSEIHSVADDVNLFDETFRQGNQNSTQVSGRIFSLPSDWLIKNGDVFIFSTNLDTSIYSYAFYIAEKPFMSSNNNFYYNSGYQTTKTFVVNSLYNGYFGFTIRKNDETNINPNDIKQFNFKIQKGTEATSYSPYNQGTVTIKQRGTTENNDYIIQTEPLRSLPNGVKDTIEAEQHRKIGKQTGTLTETTTITLSDAKTNGAYMCNIKPSGTLTGKTIELEAGDYEIIYELEEEIIEPLTQNQATTMLDIIKTGSYEGTTNIYTDEDVKPTIGVDYYKKK